MIDLYAADTANVRRVSVALEEMDLEYRVVPVKLGQGEPPAPAFLAISPNRQVPAIVDHDGPDGVPVPVFESGAILVYLSEKTGMFLPPSGRPRLAVLQWLTFQLANFGPSGAHLLHFRERESCDCGRQRFEAEILRHYEVMDRRLAERDFFADELSIADFAAVGWVSRHGRHGVGLEQFGHVARWYARMTSRPGVRKGLSRSL